MIMLGVYFLAFAYALYLGFSSPSDGDKEVVKLKNSLLTVEHDALEARNTHEKLRLQLLKLESELEKKTAELNAREPLMQSLKADMVTFQTSAATKTAEAEVREKEISRLTVELERAGAAARESAKLKEALNAVNAQAQAYKNDLENMSGEIAQKNNDLRQSADVAAELRKAMEELQAKALLITAAQQEIKALTADLEKARSQSQGEDNARQEEIFRLTAELGQKSGEIAHKNIDLQQAAGVAAELKKAREELQAKSLLVTTAQQEILALTADLEKVRSRSQGDDKARQEAADAAAAAQQKILQLTVDLEQARSQSGTADAQGEEFQKISTELKDMKDVLQIKIFELTARDREIKKLKADVEKARSGAGNSDQADYGARLARLKASEADILQIEKSLDEEKQALRAMKLRVSEGKMKLQLLNEKTKETVELIAQFAEGKEFEEFRKAIHMDDTISKYEDEIKSLQIKVMDLEKKDR